MGDGLKHSRVPTWLAEAVDAALAPPAETQPTNTTVIRDKLLVGGDSKAPQASSGAPRLFALIEDPLHGSLVSRLPAAVVMGVVFCLIFLPLLRFVLPRKMRKNGISLPLHHKVK